MSDDGGDPKKSNIHGLVLFNYEQDESKSSIQDYYSLESVDQENAIKLMTDLRPFSGKYRYLIAIINESIAPITEIKVRVKYPSFLNFNRISPPNIKIKSIDKLDKFTYQVSINFDEIDGNQNKQIALYFTPENFNKMGEIKTFVTFVNNKDFVRVLNSDPAEIKIDPILIEPKILPSNEVRNFLQTDNIKKGIRSLGVAVENDINFGLYFNNLEHILKLNNLHLITKDEEKMIAWFFGNDVESKEDILVIGQILNNKIEILAASRLHRLIISFLTKIVINLKKRLMSTGYVKNEDDFIDLECKYCGAILSKFPNKGEQITCNNCKIPQIVWK